MSTNNDHDHDEIPFIGEPSQAGDPIADFFARERAGIEELPGNAEHLESILQTAREEARPSWARRGLIGLAAAALIGGGIALGSSQLGGNEAAMDPASNSSNSASTTATDDPAPSTTAPTGGESTTSTPDDSSTSEGEGETSDVTPTEQPVPTSVGLTAFGLSSSDGRYALGTAECGDADCPVVLRSNTGGSVWRSVSSHPGLAVDSLRFADDNVGWLTGDVIRRTTDGGRTFEDYAHPGGKVVAAEVDGGVVRFVTARACGETTCTIDVLEAAVSDTSVSRVVHSTTAAVTEGIQLVTDGATAYLVSHGSDLKVGLVRLGDATATLDNPCEESARLTLRVAADGSHALRALCQRTDGDGVSLTSLRSDDGGQTWSQAQGPTAMPAALRSVTAPSADRLVAALADGALQVSNDGGVTWAGPDSSPGSLSWVGAGGAGHVNGFDAGSGVYWTSSDSGWSWSRVSLRG
ncbi:hypothetical protein [Janibacter sp. G56]|uniref:hypothetical protein n=1 Tax=Janibacter sp. G56 TaxID=3418717 RepID=UPI003D04ECC2